MAYNKNTDWDNESKYLNNLIQNGNAGEKAWASNQMNVLNAAQAQYGGTSSNNTSSYTPTTNTSSGGSSYSGGSGVNSQYSSNPTYAYVIGSEKGKNIAQNLAEGTPWYNTADGSTWTKQSDGSVTVEHNGIITNNAYVPSTQQNNQDDAWAQMLNYMNGFMQQYQQPVQQQRDPRIDQTLNEILTRDDFFYNALDDPLYQQYSQLYQREGDRAMRETLAEVAAGAGGMNTYAITAAQQAANYYNSQLNDRIPQLYQLAYDMYLNDKESQVQDLGILQNMDSTQYNRYRDTMNDWYNDKNFAYGMYQDAVSQGNYMTQFDYDSQWANKYFDNENYWNNKNFNANQAQIELENSRQDREDAQKEIEILINLDRPIPSELITRSGWTQATIDALIAEKKDQDEKKKKIDDPIIPKGDGKVDIAFDDVIEGLGNKAETGNITPYGSTIAEITANCDELFETGGWTAVQGALNEARAVGLIDQNTFMKLFNKYRDM